MSVLKIQTEWEDPKRAKGLELRATWGALRIEVVGSNHDNLATRFYDKHLDTVRAQVYLPLYPLAEWLSFNWFQMLHGTRRFSDRCHGIRQAAEGFALPNLSIWSEGSNVQVVWDSFADEGAQVEFLNEGEYALPREAVEQELAGFLNKVVNRLKEKGIERTPLQEEWAAILAMDPDEQSFCIAAASLGLDPFDLPTGMEQEILGAGQLLTQNVREEFFPAATSSDVFKEAEAVASAIQELETKRVRNPRLDRIRMSVPRGQEATVAWQAGYELARQAKARLSMPEGRVEFGALEELTAPLEIGSLSRVARVEGLVSRNGESGASGLAPSFADRRPDSRKFALARILCEELLLPAAQASLLTKETTTRQKMNRAFAAEFLAPAAELKIRFKGPEVSSDEVQDLADEYAVSTYVIENQIRNHRLATVTH